MYTRSIKSELKKIEVFDRSTLHAPFHLRVTIPLLCRFHWSKLNTCFSMEYIIVRQTLRRVLYSDLLNKHSALTLGLEIIG